MAPERNGNVFSIMIDPRGFMRRFSSTWRSSTWVVAWLLGFVTLLGKAFAFSLGLKYQVGWIFLFALVFGIPVGYIAIYINAVFLFWTGKIFRGQATFQQVVDAFTWTRVVEVFPLLSWLGLMAMFKKMVFTPEFVDSEQYSMVMFGFIGLQTIFDLWQALILFHALGEVQKLSAWITIWNVLFAAVLLLIVDGGVNWLFSSKVVMGSLNVMSSFFYR